MTTILVIIVILLVVGVVVQRQTIENQDARIEELVEEKDVDNRPPHD